MERTEAPVLLPTHGAIGLRIHIHDASQLPRGRLQTSIYLFVQLSKHKPSSPRLRRHIKERGVSSIVVVLLEYTTGSNTGCKAYSYA